MSDIYEKLAKLRELYLDDIEQMEGETKRVQKLLEQQEFYLLPATQELLALCRKDILTDRMKLATERNLLRLYRSTIAGPTRLVSPCSPASSSTPPRTFGGQQIR